jgi:GT2 family glycosyltransferase
MRINGISVVVPTCERVDMVSELLQSCEVAGHQFDGLWEVILVDSSPPPAAQLIRELCTRHNARYVTGPWRAGSKRNVGARLANYDVVLFIDSDCTATTDLFAEHARAYEQSQEHVVAVAGLTLLQGETGLLWRILSRSREHNIPFSWPRYFSSMHWAPTSNLSVRSHTFHEIGGFDDETWTVTGCEDVDFGVRIWGAGGRIVSNDQAVVRHSRSEVTNPGQVMKKLSRHGQADVWIGTKHPHHYELRANPIAVMSLSILTGILVSIFTISIRPIFISLTSVPVVWICTLLGRINCWSGHDRHLEPLAILIDWAFDLGIVKASIRHLRPSRITRRFRYYSPKYFSLKPGYDRIPNRVFYAYGAYEADSDVVPPSLS